MAVAGVGYGTLNPASTTAAMSWFPPRQRATVVGLKQVGLPFGGMLGAAILPTLALSFGWRRAVVASALAVGACAVLSAAVYRDPPGEPLPARKPGERGAIALVLSNRDLWLVALATLVFAGMQTVWMAFLALYLQAVVGLSLLAASRYLAVAQGGGVLGRVAFGVLSDRVFGGRRRLPLAIAGCGSALCSIALAYTGPGTSTLWLGLLALVFGFVGIGWNGVQHTLMAELAGPRTAGTAVGLGLAISSLGVTIGPPIFGWCVTAAGGFRGPWLGLAGVMVGGLGLLALARERPRL
jgi:predicted MFS family arabinose efflux permease